jgi:sulfoxide reductase catalytic subunit YedY
MRYSDVTPQHLYLDRRRFISASAATLASLALPASGQQNLLNDRLPAKRIATIHNNFYEFGTGKTEPAERAPAWKWNPEWPVRLEGAVKTPKTVSLPQILKLAPLEERIYRMRCVEGWSMIVPWTGFPLSTLLKQVEPLGSAKYVAFESYYDPRVMLSPREANIRFPYIEALRLDEAMHPLTLLVTGVYGAPLPNQSGAPLRLVVPWKYGFKGIKSITRIRFLEKPPATTWSGEWPQAYGFYANVNPKVAHPRYDQDVERRLDGEGLLGQGQLIRTEMFNGYGAQVASLYADFNLVKNY